MKIDPSQTKAVVVLLIVLGVAVVATVARIHPSAGPPAAVAAPTTVVAQVNSECVTVVPAFQSSRNPFRKPDLIRAILGNKRRAGAPSGADAAMGNAAQQSSGGVLPAWPPPGARQEPTSGQTDKAEPKKPQFVLLATVGGPGGLCAVIRSGESNTRVVGVGDILEGGYKVGKLEPGRVVLTKGEGTVVIKKPS